MKILSGLLCTSLCFGAIPIAKAQIAPVCREVAADADGDGFGWQDNNSCIVTQESEPAPVFTNLETNEFVNLTRAYWNAPADLYNKTITCVAHHFIRDTGTYVADNDPDRETHYTFHYTHLPLTATAPYTGTVRSEHIVSPGPDNDVFQTYYNQTFVTWSMDNGIYTGGAPFSGSPYVEIVTVPSTNLKEIRTWRGNGDFVQCTAVPTGVPPSNNTGENSDTSSNNNDTASQINSSSDNGSNTDTNTDTNANDDDTNTNSSTNSSVSTEILESTSGNTNAVISNDDSSLSRASANGGGSFGLWFLLPMLALKRLRNVVAPV